MYGNYCGPYWSAGQWQESVISHVMAIDDLDQLCKEHDAVYALNGDLLHADIQFVFQAANQGVIGLGMASVVGIQALLRGFDKYTNPINQTTMPQSKKNLRGNMPAAISHKAKQQLPTKPSKSATNAGTTLSAAPVSFGTTIRASPPTIVRRNDSASVSGRDFVGTVEGHGILAFGLGKSALLSPAYFNSTILGNIARSYERYRFRRLRVHYVPKVATSATGQVVLCSQKSVSEPGLQPESGTFLQRAMSQGNAVFTPLWVPAYIDIDCDNEWRLVDPTTTSDIDDCIHEELQVYSQINIPAQVGYLIAEYSIDFKEPIYQPHSTYFPLATGPGQRVRLFDKDAVSAPNDDFVLTDTNNALGLTPATNGAIYRAVFDLQGSSPPVGATFANYLMVLAFARTNTTTTGSTGVGCPLIGGFTMYLVNIGGNLWAYTSLEAAINGSGSGQLFVSTATTAVGSYYFDVALVRLGLAILPVVQ
jgi:hypothetical protein